MGCHDDYALVGRHHRLPKRNVNRLMILTKRTLSVDTLLICTVVADVISVYRYFKIAFIVCTVFYKPVFASVSLKCDMFFTLCVRNYYAAQKFTKILRCWPHLGIRL